MIFRRKLARLSLKVWSSKGNLMDLGRVFHSFGPMTAKDVSYRVTERLVANWCLWVGTSAMGPLLSFVENFMPISLGTLWCSIFQTRTMMYRSLHLWSDISFSFFKRSQ